MLATRERYGLAPLALVALALIGFVLGACGFGQEEKRPNVLLVVVDTTRVDALSSYGHPKPTTPRIDRLAEEGVRFTQAIAPDFWTLPSHASLLTGQYPSQHQATSETNHLPVAANTLAERLQEAGYDTAAFVSNPWLSAERGFSQGFMHYSELWQEPNAGGAESVRDRHGIEEATKWIADRRKGGAPFFLFVNLMTPHLPYTPDPLTLVELTPEPRPMDRVQRLMRIQGAWAHLVGRLPLDALDRKILRELYEAEVAMTDSMVDRLADALRETAILDGTLVIVTSDHGENLGEHDMLDHVMSMYETTLHIPLIMRYPATFPPETIRSDLVSLVDVVPTVLDICAIGMEPGSTAGRSLASANVAGPDFVVAENERPVNAVKLLRTMYPEFDASGVDEQLRALRTDRYKLIWHSQGNAELFDLESDPGEEHDLASARPALRARLGAELERWMRTHRSDVEPAPFESRDRRALEQLRALGYVD